METLVLKTELDVAQGEYLSRDQFFSPEGRFADDGSPGLQLIRPMYICRSLSLKRKKCEKTVTTHCSLTTITSLMNLCSLCCRVLYVFGRIDISQGVTSLGESTFGRNDRTEFHRA